MSRPACNKQIDKVMQMQADANRCKQKELTHLIKTQL